MHCSAAAGWRCSTTPIARIRTCTAVLKSRDAAVTSNHRHAVAKPREECGRRHSLDVGRRSFVVSQFSHGGRTAVLLTHKISLALWVHNYFCVFVFLVGTRPVAFGCQPFAAVPTAVSSLCEGINRCPGGDELWPKCLTMRSSQVAPSFHNLAGHSRVLPRWTSGSFPSNSP